MMRSSDLRIGITALILVALAGLMLAPSVIGQTNQFAPPYFPPHQDPGYWTPPEWIPKLVDSPRDTDQNFIDDQIDGLGFEESVDVILCLNARPDSGDLLQFGQYGQVAYVSPYLTVAVLQNVPAGFAPNLAAHPRVAFVELDDPIELYLQTSLQAIRMIGSAAYPTENVETVYPWLDGGGRSIAVIDTGIDFGHEQLPASRFVGGYDSTTFFPFQTNPDDTVGHGTHVASIAGGWTPSGSSPIRGVATGAGLVDIKVFRGSSGTTSAIIMQALSLCILEQARWRIGVVNMSLGGSRPSNGTDALSQMVNRTVMSGMVVAVAMGNHGAHLVPSPAAADLALSVGALDDRNTDDRSDDGPATFTNFGPRLSDRDNDRFDELKPTVSAPGVDIVAARHNTFNGYVSFSGTSMAAPHVAGLAAVLQQQFPTAPPSFIRERIALLFLCSVSPASWDPFEGFAYLDAYQSASFQRVQGRCSRVDFAPVAYAATPAQPRRLVAGNLDPSLSLELVVACESGELAVFERTNRGFFVNTFTTPVPFQATELALGDYDRDGLLDAIVSSHYGPGSLKYLGDGTGRLNPDRVLASRTPLHTLLADVSGDGAPDFLTASGGLDVLYNDGTGRFSPYTSFPTIENPWSLAVADLDRDGDLDVLSSDTGHSGHSVSFLYNDGTGSFAPPHQALTPGYVGEIVSGDFDRDGLPDVALSYTSNYIAVLVALSDGTGGFKSQNLYLTADSSEMIAVGDMDLDGFPDLVVAGGKHASVLINDGYGAFNQQESFVIGNGGPHDGLAVADFDGDGDLDVATSEWANDRLAILWNRRF